MGDPFLHWLDSQPYWIRNKDLQEQWPNIKFKNMIGITTKIDDNGDTLIPRRDYRKHYHKRTSDYVELTEYED